MRLGLGTGSTVAHLLPALADRRLKDVRCVATSPATEQAARALGLTVVDFDELPELDMAIDGADQIDPAGWLIKGGGGAHTREKIVAAAASRFVVIASSEKAVERLTPLCRSSFFASARSGPFSASPPPSYGLRPDPPPPARSARATSPARSSAPTAV